ncbi:MAG TPA: hypothetical protein VGY57_03545 [Vicinamibacterales bacterium]|nr:hypothetical protein [Vicinamibacterales bacterium]
MRRDMSFLTLRNDTTVPATFVIGDDEREIARRDVEPGGQAIVSTTIVYQVVAVTHIEGNAYTAGPIDVTAGTDLLAEVRQQFTPGTYEFAVVSFGSRPGLLIFQKTSDAPVTFFVTKNGAAFQNVVVESSFVSKQLVVQESYTVAVRANGVAVAPAVTSDPDATIVLSEDSGEHGYLLTLR